LKVLQNRRKLAIVTLRAAGGRFLRSGSVRRNFVSDRTPC
jgi:hypothetical protein